MNYIDPHRPKLPSDDIVVNAEFSRHFVFKKCKHPNWIDEDDNIRQMTEREYKRALLPLERQTPFKDDDGETWHFWSLERCTEDQREKYYTLMGKVANEDLLYRVWENDALRFLVFDEWNVDASLSRIRGKNDYLKKYGHPI